MKIYYNNKSLTKNLFIAILLSSLFSTFILRCKENNLIFLLPLFILLFIVIILYIIMLIKNKSSYYINIEDDKIEFNTLCCKTIYFFNDIEYINFKKHNIIIIDNSGKKRYFSLLNLTDKDIEIIKDKLFHKK